MNSKPTRAPSKALQSENNSLLTRFGTRIKAIALVALLFTASAFATPSTQIANQGINQPRGMVRSTVPNPVIGGLPLHDYWISDTVRGFCRIDQVPDPANPGFTHGVLNAGTCYAPGIFEPSDYQVETNGVNGSNGYVFVGSTLGISRLNFIVDPSNPAKTVVDTAHITVFFGTGSLFLNAPSTYTGETMTLAKGTATITVSGSSTKTIVSIGSSGRALRTITATVTVSGGNYALSTWSETP